MNIFDEEKKAFVLWWTDFAARMKAIGVDLHPLHREAALAAWMEQVYRRLK